jgi:hypothetical protein
MSRPVPYVIAANYVDRWYWWWDSPTAKPTMRPTPVPSSEPTAVPTAVPTAMPTNAPTQSPTAHPTRSPTIQPQSHFSPLLAAVIVFALAIVGIGLAKCKRKSNVQPIRNVGTSTPNPVGELSPLLWVSSDSQRNQPFSVSRREVQPNAPPRVPDLSAVRDQASHPASVAMVSAKHNNTIPMGVSAVIPQTSPNEMASYSARPAIRTKGTTQPGGVLPDASRTPRSSRTPSRPDGFRNVPTVPAEPSSSRAAEAGASMEFPRTYLHDVTAYASRSAIQTTGTAPPEVQHIPRAPPRDGDFVNVLTGPTEQSSAAFLQSYLNTTISFSRSSAILAAGTTQPDRVQPDISRTPRAPSWTDSLVNVPTVPAEQSRSRFIEASASQRYLHEMTSYSASSGIRTTGPTQPGGVLPDASRTPRSSRTPSRPDGSGNVPTVPAKPSSSRAVGAGASMAFPQTYLREVTSYSLSSAIQTTETAQPESVQPDTSRTPRAPSWTDSYVPTGPAEDSRSRFIEASASQRYLHEMTSYSASSAIRTTGPTQPREVQLGALSYTPCASLRPHGNALTGPAEQYSTRPVGASAAFAQTYPHEMIWHSPITAFQTAGTAQPQGVQPNTSRAPHALSRTDLFVNVPVVPAEPFSTRPVGASTAFSQTGLADMTSYSLSSAVQTSGTPQPRGVQPSADRTLRRPSEMDSSVNVPIVPAEHNLTRPVGASAAILQPDLEEMASYPSSSVVQTTESAQPGSDQPDTYHPPRASSWTDLFVDVPIVPAEHIGTGPTRASAAKPQTPRQGTVSHSSSPAIRTTRMVQPGSFETDSTDIKPMRKLKDCIDKFIRTNPGFNSLVPMQFKISLDKLLSATVVQEMLQSFNKKRIQRGKQSISLEQFLNHSMCFTLENGKVNVNHVTPYQGDQRMFGEFLCSNCRREWSSCRSWKGFGQNCKSCNSYCYPFVQHPLEHSDAELDNNKPHDEARCGKCRSLGRSCLP